MSAPLAPRMRRSRAERTARAIAVTSVVLALATIGNFIGAWNFSAGFAVLFVSTIPVLIVVYTAVGNLIVRAEPRHPLGWIFVAMGAVAAAWIFTTSYSVLALDHGLPLMVPAAWLGFLLLPATLLPVGFVFLLFPDGHAPSPRWRAAGWLIAIGGAGLVLALALTPDPALNNLADYGARIPNPTGIGALRGWGGAAGGASAVVVLLGGLLAAASLVVRFRRSAGEERQQMRWMSAVGAAAGVFLLAMVVLALTVPQRPDGTNSPGVQIVFSSLMGLFAATLAFGIPGASAIAILRYRLYDLDLVVRKTVLIAVLAAFIGGVYVVIVVGVGALVGSERSGPLSFVAAAVLAAVFQPARDRARRIADRLVFGERATPYEVLSEFSERARDAYSTDDVLPRMAEIVGRGIAAERVTVWLRVGDELRPAASWPAAPSPEAAGLGAVKLRGEELPDLGRFGMPVRHHGDLLGAISVTPSRGEPLDPAKTKLVSHLAAQTGLVLRNARLVEELRASRQRIITAQDDRARALERNIHDGAQQQLVAIGVRLRLARTMLSKDPGRADTMLDELGGATQTALEDLRDLARGIYPPLLADQGLPAALAAQGRKSTLEVTVEPDGVARYPREVESAVYFCVLEALNNVAKYAEATTVAIRLSQADGELRFEAEDDGRGFDPAETGYGTGLQGMADRLDAVGGRLQVRSSAGAGTTVSGSVPVASQEPERE